MKTKAYVKVSKVNSVDNPVYPTPPLATYEAGKFNAEVSIPNEYWLEGYLVQGPEVGKSVVVQREIRCGVKATGIFQSSAVTEITEEGFNTLNSIYILEYLDKNHESL